MRQVKIVFLLWAMYMCSILVACSSLEQQHNIQHNESLEKRAYEATYTEQEQVNVFEEKWQRKEDLKISEEWQVENYEGPLFQVDSGKERIFDCRIDGQNLYVLYFVSDEEQISEKTYILRNIDLKNMTQGQSSFALDDDELITDFDISNGRICLFVEKYDEENGTTGLYASFFENGKMEEKTDLLNVVKNIDMFQKGQYFQGNCRYDGQENLFVITGYDQNSGGVVGLTGELLYSFSEISSQIDAIYSPAIKCENGATILKAYSPMNHRTALIGINREKAIKLCEYEGIFQDQNAVCDKYGNISFLEQGAQITNWNIKNGDIRTYVSGNFGDDSGILAIIRKETGNIVEVTDDYEGISIVEYGPVMNVEDTTITIEALSAVDDSVKSGIRFYERTHPHTKIQLKEFVGEQDKEQKKGQLYAKLSSSNGPDLIYMGRTDMLYFAEKGCLLDLSDIITEETEDVFFTGIKTGGSWNDGWYMIPTSVNVSAVYVNRDCYSDGKWEMNDLINIIKKREDEGRPFEDIWLLYENHADSSELLQFFIDDVIHSEFVNIEEKKCDFESEKFGEILELCKHYGKDEKARMPISREDRSEKLLQQEILCFSEPLLSFGHFSEVGASLGENANIVGMPTNAASGFQLTSMSGIAVNKDTKQLDAINDFLDCMFNQQYCASNPVNQIPTRRDCLENKISLDSDWAEQAVVYISKRESMRVNRKADGTSFEKEYIDFLNQCIPYDERNNAIISIILEDAAPFFYGDKEAMEVQRIIQSRVKLYLEENQ